MKGFKTLFINGGIAALVALLTYAIGVDWSEYVSPTVAMVILAAANFGLRFLTDTPVGKAE